MHKCECKPLLKPLGVNVGTRLTSGCVNSGAWSFLSAMVMVAVAVPVRPTSLPAMSLATISSSYLVVGSVWKI